MFLFASDKLQNTIYRKFLKRRKHFPWLNLVHVHTWRKLEMYSIILSTLIFLRPFYHNIPRSINRIQMPYLARVTIYLLGDEESAGDKRWSRAGTVPTASEREA